MTSLFSQPQKLKRAGAMSFGIPAKKTCPNHGRDPLSICSTCYADKGFYNMPNVKRAYEYRFELTKKPHFANIVNSELNTLRYMGKLPKYFRIHDSGDFYSDKYLRKWLGVVISNPDVHFYNYTKEVGRFLSMFGDSLEKLPKNWTVCFSYGGEQDHLINPDIHRHSFAFPSKEHLDVCGYVDASYNDLEMLNTTNHRIGLIEH